MKSLYNVCLSFLATHLHEIDSAAVDCLPIECKEHLLEWLCSHDSLLGSPVLASRCFVASLRQVSFFLSEEVTDAVLASIGSLNRRLTHISVVYCNQVTDRGVRALTEHQSLLETVELKGLSQLTSFGIAGIVSERLWSVDLSGCPLICDDGVIHLVTHNRRIQRLYLNNCSAVDDLGIYAIGAHLGDRLLVLQLDFVDQLIDPSGALTHLTECCPNLTQLSLRRYFCWSSSRSLHVECKIHSHGLRELDLFGNYLAALPSLPASIHSLRLSCSGCEDADRLVRALNAVPSLSRLCLVISCQETAADAVQAVNDFLATVLVAVGDKITSLQVTASTVDDRTMGLIVDRCVRLASFSLNALHVTPTILAHLFCDGDRAAAIECVKFRRVRLPCRLLHRLAGHCRRLREVELSFMSCVDDRLLTALAANCTRLECVNFNGCRWVTDKGLCALARNCPLREVRVRATSVTDRCLYVLARCCPNLEWIAHADYSGKPKFSPSALRTLKQSCVKRPHRGEVGARALRFGDVTRADVLVIGSSPPPLLLAVRHRRVTSVPVNDTPVAIDIFPVTLTTRRLPSRYTGHLDDVLIIWSDRQPARGRTHHNVCKPSRFWTFPSRARPPHVRL